MFRYSFELLAVEPSTLLSSYTDAGGKAFIEVRCERRGASCMCSTFPGTFVVRSTLPEDIVRVSLHASAASPATTDANQAATSSTLMQVVASSGEGIAVGGSGSPVGACWVSLGAESKVHLMWEITGGSEEAAAAAVLKMHTDTTTSSEEKKEPIEVPPAVPQSSQATACIIVAASQGGDFAPCISSDAPVPVPVPALPIPALPTISRDPAATVVTVAPLTNSLSEVQQQQQATTMLMPSAASIPVISPLSTGASESTPAVRAPAGTAVVAPPIVTCAVDVPATAFAVTATTPLARRSIAAFTASATTIAESPLTELGTHRLTTHNVSFSTVFPCTPRGFASVDTAGGLSGDSPQAPVADDEQEEVPEGREEAYMHVIRSFPRCRTVVMGGAEESTGATETATATGMSGGASNPAAAAAVAVEGELLRNYYHHSMQAGVNSEKAYQNLYTIPSPVLSQNVQKFPCLGRGARDDADQLMGNSRFGRHGAKGINEPLSLRWQATSALESLRKEYSARNEQSLYQSIAGMSAEQAELRRSVYLPANDVRGGPNSTLRQHVIRSQIDVQSTMQLLHEKACRLVEKRPVVYK